MAAKQSVLAAATEAQAASGWTLGLRVVHWVGAALIIGMIALGLYMKHADIGAGEAFDLFQWHKSFGFVALALIAIRVVIRARAGRPAFPPSMSAPEIALARAAHAMLYGLLIALPILGWITVSAASLPVPTRLFDVIPVPHLMGPNETVYEAARLAHRLAAWTLTALIALHVAAALKHHFVDRDATLRQMLFGRRAAP